MTGPEREGLLRLSDAAEPYPMEASDEALAALPRPRKHYQWYFSSRQAEAQCSIAGKAYTISCARTADA